MSDLIDRQAAIEALKNRQDDGKGDISRFYNTIIQHDIEAIEQLPPAQPAKPTPDQNGDLWITVPDIDKVTCIYVQESKSKFCRTFYEEQEQPAQPKRGKWEMGIDERFVECSECGLMTTRNELRGLAVFGKNEPNFCPNCGADMREVTT